MRGLHEVEYELKKAGLHSQFWCKPEIKELVHILTDDETITKAVNGRYKGGFALIVTTSHRLLLIDKKLWFMSLEDTRFDMITEVDYAARVFDATISVRTVSKVLHFTSIHQRQLRDLTKYLQEKIMELRQMMIQQSEAPPQYQPELQTQPMPAVPLTVNTAATTPQIPSVQQQPQPTAIAQPTPAAPIQAQLYGQPVYSRPTRLRRMGALPTASLTMQNQRYLTAKR